MLEDVVCMSVIKKKRAYIPIISPMLTTKASLTGGTGYHVSLGL